MDNPYPICENCIFADVPLGKDPCQECSRAFLAQRIKPNFVRKRKPKTNADRIRSMTDEELAYWYFNEFFCKSPYCRKEECYEDSPCEECLLDWLRQDAEEGE